MNVLYDHGIFVGQRHGGISRYFTEMASLIAKRNSIDVDIFGGIYINQYLSGMRGNKDLNIHGLYVSATDRLFRIRNAASSHLAWFLSTKYSILHHTYYYPFLDNVSSIRRVATVYDMIHEKFNVDGMNNDIIKKKRPYLVNAI